jgi:MoxR-like ATPase
MFNIFIDYPSYKDEVNVVKQTTTTLKNELNTVISGADIIKFQQLVRRIPVADQVVEYAVTLVGKTRPLGNLAPDVIKNYITWGAGPRASQNLVLAAKCHAALSGKYSPDIEDVQAVAIPILRHRIIRNYKAEAEGITVESIISEIF